MNNKLKNISGFTLMELIVTISIAGILIGLAIPSFNADIRGARLTAYVNNLVTSLNFARSEAIKRGISVTVRKISGAGNWNTSGWNIFVDTDADGNLDTGEVILRTYPALPALYTLIGTTNFVDFIRYQPDGTSTAMGSFALCADAIPLPYTSKLIIVNRVGRIRMGSDTNQDGIPEKDDTTALTSCTAP